MAKDSIRISLSIPKLVVDEIEKLAKAYNCSRSEVIRLCIKHGIDEADRAMRAKTPHRLGLLATNQRDISTNRLDTAANAAAIRNIPTIPNCSPIRSTVISRNPGRVYYASRFASTNRLCASSSPLPLGLNSACYRRVTRVSRNIQVYQTRNSQTLQCVGNIITFYSRCCVTSTIGCGHTPAGVTFCALLFPTTN